MNSWTSTFDAACAPPLRMFSIGTGINPPATPPTYLHNGSSWTAAPACRQAIETPSIAFAPRLALFGVPSNSIMTSSIAFWSSTGIPTSASCIASTTLFTALSTPFPNQRDESPSRNSMASYAPVDAPLGTIARPRRLPPT